MKKFIRKPDFEAVQLDDEWLVLNPQQYTVTTLNEAGGYCWNLLQEKQTAEEIAKMVKNHFVSGNIFIQQDIEAFLDDLVECGLVQYAD